MGIRKIKIYCKNLDHEQKNIKSEPVKELHIQISPKYTNKIINNPTNEQITN